MNKIVWNGQFKTGIPPIDIQKKKLVEIINRLSNFNGNDVTQRPLNDILNDLEDYAGFHFETEEDLMWRTNYANYYVHKAEHGNLKKQLSGILFDIKHGNISTGESSLEILNKWLLDHAQTHDREFGNFIYRNIYFDQMN